MDESSSSASSDSNSDFSIDEDFSLFNKAFSKLEPYSFKPLVSDAETENEVAHQNELEGQTVVTDPTAATATTTNLIYTILCNGKWEYNMVFM